MQEFKTSRPYLYAMYFSSFAMLMLACALVYFTVELARIAGYVPGVVNTVDRTVEKIDPIIDEVGEVSRIVPPILQEVAEIRVMIPAILDEVGQTRAAISPAIREYAKTNEQIPRIIDEYAATREMLPDILPGLLKTADNVSFAVVTVTKEIGANRDLLDDAQKTADKTADALVIIAKQVEASQPMLPDMLKSADNASNAVVVISKEIEAIRPLLPQILAEVEKTREMVPPALDKAERLVSNARQAAKEASKGATSGFLSGLFMAPFVFVGDVGKALVGADDKKLASELSERDFDLIESSASELLEHGVEGEVKAWANDSSGNYGTITLRKVSYADGRECRTIYLELLKRGSKLNDKTQVLCRTEGGEWDFQQ